MPRGYLKHAKSRQAGIGRKASRGGGSRPAVKVRADGLWIETKNRFQSQRSLLAIVEDGISDYNYDKYNDYDDTYLDFESGSASDVGMSNEVGSNYSSADMGGPNSMIDKSNYCFEAISRTSSVSGFTLCEVGPDDSSFVFVDDLSIATTPDRNDEDESYVAIDSIAKESLVSFEPLEEGRHYCDGLQQESDRQKLCAICLEEKPLLQLMRKCRKHPSACKECLREMYIVHSLNEHDHPKFPLQCFWPDCSRPLRDVQVKKLSPSPQDMERYYSFEALKKNQRFEESRQLNNLVARNRLLNNFRTIQRCPHCQHSTSVRPYQTKTEDAAHVCCIVCSNIFQIKKLPRKEFIDIIAALDKAGFCPSCGAFFVKDGGCDDMICCCGREFSFREQYSKFRQLKECADELRK